MGNETKQLRSNSASVLLTPSEYLNASEPSTPMPLSVDPLNDCEYSSSEFILCVLHLTANIECVQASVCLKYFTQYFCPFISNVALCKTKQIVYEQRLNIPSFMFLSPNLTSTSS